jgi:hypothetical protein
VQDNLAPERPEDSGNEWSVVSAPSQFRSFSRLANSGLIPIPVYEVFESVLDGAGATPRDAVDQRVVNDVRAGSGGLIYSQSDVGGWPVYGNGGGAQDVDTDGDGIPDDWEEQNAMNPLSANDGQDDSDGDGYTNIEEYINSFLGDDVDNTTTNANKNENLPDGFALLQNYPNPFNPTTTIRYNLEENSRVTLDVFDILGRHITTLVDAPRNAGLNEVDWNATAASGAGVTSGMYLYQLRATGESGKDYMETRKMFFVK